MLNNYLKGVVLESRDPDFQSRDVSVTFSGLILALCVEGKGWSIEIAKALTMSQLAHCLS